MNSIKEDFEKIFNILLGTKYKCVINVNENKSTQITNTFLESKESYKPSLAYSNYIGATKEVSEEDKYKSQRLNNPVVINLLLTKTALLSGGLPFFKKDTFSGSIFSLTELVDILELIEYNLVSQKYLKSGLSNYVFSTTKSLSYDQNGQQIIRFSIEKLSYSKPIINEVPIDSFNINKG